MSDINKKYSDSTSPSKYNEFENDQGNPKLGLSTTELNDHMKYTDDESIGNVSITSKLNVKPSKLMWFSFLAMTLQSLNYGLGIAMVNNTEAVIKSYFNLTVDQYTWVTSILPLGGIIGGVCGGKIVDILGPKTTSLWNDFGYIVAIAILAASQNYAMLLVGRFFLGLFIGITCACVPQYVAEISPTQWRGVLGVGHQQNITLGILIAAILGLSQVFGTHDLWRLVYGAPLVPAIIHAICILFCPESPFHLAKHGHKEKAIQVLESLRDDEEEKIRNEVNLMEEEISKADLAKEENLSFLQAIKLIFTKRSLFVPFSMALFAQFAQQASGINAIMFYSTKIFERADTGISAEAATCMTMAINCIAGFFGFFIIDKMGRKGSLLFGFAGMALFHVLFSISVIENSYEWQITGIVFILLYVICFAVGPGPVPWMITSDLIPNKIRSVSIGLAVGLNWLVVFVIARIFPAMQSALEGYTFLVFGGICAGCFLIFLFFLLETNGMTRKQIDSWFENGHVLAPSPFRKQINIDDEEYKIKA